MRKNLIFPLVLLLLLILPTTTNATQNPTVNRLAGVDRYETAFQIAKAGWQQSDFAILAYGENYPDALAAVPLAKKLNAPILLTNIDSLNIMTSTALKDLKVKTVYIVGGISVISANQESTLTNTGYTVIRLAGQDRYETAIKIAEQLGNISEVAVTSGDDYADALSIGAIAAEKQMPIILVPKDEITSSIQNYISSKTITKSYVVGGQEVISDNVVNKFSNPERITGQDKYARNIAILNKFTDIYHHDKICLATGENFADALAGAVYAAENNGAVALVKSDLPASTNEFLKGNIVLSNNFTVFGGEAVVSSSLLQSILDFDDKWAVRVNGDQILIKDYDDRVNLAQKTYEKQGLNFDTEQGKQALRQIKSQVLDRMIEGRLIAQEVKNQNLDIEDAAVKAQEDVIKKNIGDATRFQDILNQQGMTEQELKNFLTVYSKVTSDVKVSESDAKAFFDKNIDKYGQPESVTARHILLKTEDEAKAIIAQLIAGGDFIQLAKDNSIEPGASQSGGDLGTFTKGKMVPEFETAAFSQNVGTFSTTPVKTEFGYHVILVEAHTAAVAQDYTKVKAQVEQDVLNQVKDAKFQTYFNDLRKKAKIEYSNGF